MNGFLALTNEGVVRAVAGGERKWDLERPLASLDVTCISAAPTSERPVYAGTNAGLILVSNDTGRTWRPAGSVGKEVRSIAVSASAPETIYAGTKPPFVFVSEDFGATWVELVEFRKIPWRWLWCSPAELPFSAYVQAMAVSPVNPEIILAGIEAGAVVRSEDGGLTWEGHRRGAVRDCHSLIYHPRDGRWAYEAGGSGNGAAFSSDGGVTWAQPRGGLDRHYCWAVAADCEVPRTWFVSVSPGAFRAHGNGNAQAYVFRMGADGSWNRLSGGLPQPLRSMPYSLATLPANPRELYAGLHNGDVWQSRDSGETWERLPFNLGSIERTLIVI